jgi:hypothetical protein
MVYDVRSIDGINRRHPVVQTKREIFVEHVGTFIRAVDDAYREGRGPYWCCAFALVFTRRRCLWGFVVGKREGDWGYRWTLWRDAS